MKPKACFYIGYEGIKPLIVCEGKNKNKMRVNKIIKLIFKGLLLLAGLYFLIGGVLIFRRSKKISPAYSNSSGGVDKFLSSSEGPDRVVILDNPRDAGLARLKIIGDAKKRLDVSYFSIESGESPELFFAALLEAADRGVEVRVLLDGIFHGVKGELRPILYTSQLHPNLDIKFYEPLNPLLPWTINNRMHDKYILADGEVAMIGGRNIGDKYYDPDWYRDKVTLDRDVVIINAGSYENSVLKSMEDYFKEIWNHKFSKKSDKIILLFRKKIALDKYTKLRDKLEKLRTDYRDSQDMDFDLGELSLATNKITFIHNPLERFSKDPWCWYEISTLIGSAKGSIFIQSPYTIPGKGMLENFLDEGDFKDKTITLLTNSLASSPNYPAFSAYLNHRKNLVDWGMNIYEFQSKNSLHTKAFILDDELMALGSFNADSRSAFLSTESMVVIHGKEAVESLEGDLRSYLDSSLLVGPDYSYIPREGVNELPVPEIKRLIMTLLSYLLKPFEYLL